MTGANERRAPTPAAVHQAYQGQLETRSIELSAKALATAELAADGIGSLRDEMHAGFKNLSDRNDQQHNENKTAMEQNFQLLHGRISGEKETRQALQVKVLLALAALLGGLSMYLLLNDAPFQRRGAAPDITIQQRNTP